MNSESFISLPLVYNLNKEDLIHKYEIEKNRMFTHSLLPNNVNIFSLKRLSEDVVQYVSRLNPDSFLLLLLPIYKHLWKEKTLFLKKTRTKSEICCESSTFLQKNLDFAFLKLEGNEDFFRELLIDGKYERREKKIIIEFEEIVYSFTFEAYSFLFLHSFKTINREIIKINEDSSFFFILGLVEAGIELGIVSVPFKQEIFKKNIYGFDFSTIGLKSMYISNQLKLFDVWANKKDILLTGGTGIGKTSQIPKIFWWINFLFDGYENIDFDNFNFVLDNIEISKRSTVLSLPRKILINENSKSIANSLGFKTIKNSPINCKYKDVRQTIFFNPKAATFISPFIFSINRSTTYDNVNTLIYDEIHEHDIFCDIGISVIKKYKKKFKIRNLVLITATIVDDLPILKNFIKEIEHIHIPGTTLYPIEEIDESMTCNRKNGYSGLEKIITENSIESGKSTIIFFSSRSQLDHKEEYLKTKLTDFYVLIKLSRETLIEDSELLKKIEIKDKHVIILSTPIAESSLTIPNAKIVIDTGLFYCKKFISGQTIPITQSMLEQRKGRVGRISPGKYIKLFSEVNSKFKKIDFDFLFPYILTCFHYKMKFTELFILPSDMSRFDKTIKYFDERGLDLKKKYKKVYELFNRQPVSLDEYYIILMNGTKTQKDFIIAYEELSEKKKLISLQLESNIVSSITSMLNISCKVVNRNDKKMVVLKDYYEKVLPFFPNVSSGFNLDDFYLFSPNNVVN